MTIFDCWGEENLNINDVLLCLLLKYGIPKTYIERMDAVKMHLYDVFSPRLSPEELTEIIFNRKNQKSVELFTNIKDRYDIGSIKSDIDSIDLLYAFGEKAVNANFLTKKDIHTISQLKQNLNLINNNEITLYDKGHYERLLPMIDEYDIWFNDNRNEIQQEFDLSNSSIKAENVPKGRTKAKRKELRYFKIDKFPNSFAEFMNMDFEYKDVITLEMQGYNLREIGERIGVTRERIRQIEAKVGSYLPEFEDLQKYQKLYTTYDITKDEFENLTGENAEIFYGLKIKYGNNGSNSINQLILLSTKLTDEFKRDFLRDKGVFINSKNQLNKINRANVLNDVLRINRTLLNAKEFGQLINEYVEKNKLPSKLLITNEHSLSNHIEYLNAIRRIKGFFRYYDINGVSDYLEDIRELFDVNDGIYGIEYFYQMNPSLMKEIDIRDASELANLIKQIGYDKFSNIKNIERQSQVWIGKITPEKFYKNILIKFDNKPLDDFLDYICENYYLNRGTVQALMVTNYSEYIHNNIIMFVVEMPQDKEFYLKCKKELTKAIYSFDMFSNKINDIDETVSVTPQLIARLGYRERGETVVNDKFSSQKEAIDNYLLNQDYVSSYDIAEYHIRTMDMEVYYLEQSHDLLRISDEKYMTIRKFENSGFFKKDIVEFVNNLCDFINPNKFFTWKSLLSDGFTDYLIDSTGFDRVFFERLIFTISNIRTTNTKVPIFLLLDNTDVNSSPTPSLCSFFEQIMTEDKEDIDDFSDYLEQRYGVKLDNSKIIEKLQNSKLVYSPEMHKIYRSEQIMLDDIYD